MENLSATIKNSLDQIDGKFALNIVFCDTPHAISFSHRESYHPASVIKLFVLYEALHQVAKGKLRLDTSFNLTQEDKVDGCGVLCLLHDDLSITLEDLLTLMITISDNTGTNILIDILGTHNINNTLYKLGITDTQVNRKLMNPIPGVHNFTTANDVTQILKAFLHPTMITQTLADKALNILSKQQLNSNLSKHLICCGSCSKLLMGDTVCKHCHTNTGSVDPIPVKFYHKTGEITGHVHDAGILEVDGKRIIVSLLSKDLVNNDATRLIFNKIGLLLFDYLSRPQNKEGA